jgi:hypothetical protein
MSITDGLVILGMAVFIVASRAFHYRQIFGRWVVRLRPEERKRLLSSDNRAAYRKGFEDGKRAAGQGENDGGA